MDFRQGHLLESRAQVSESAYNLQESPPNSTVIGGNHRGRQLPVRPLCHTVSIMSVQTTSRPLTPLENFFRQVRSRRVEILKAFRDPLKFCLALIDKKSRPSTKNLSKLLDQVDADHRDYAVSSAYAILIGPERRKELAAYFTPPAVAAAAMRAADKFLKNVPQPSALDPACGGGSFIVPLTRALVVRHIANGKSVRRACAVALKQVHGLELDEGLARLAKRLLSEMLEREFGYKKKSPPLIRTTNALTARTKTLHDVVIGNPPYGRVLDRLPLAVLKRAGDAANGGHTNLYSLFILRALDWVRPRGGLVFILPTSFVAGPYFSGLRMEILRRAKVVSIDVHDQRENLFLGAVQDICVLTLARREVGEQPRTGETYELGFIDAHGHRHLAGKGLALIDGEPWLLPVGSTASASKEKTARRRSKRTLKHDRHWVLEDYGYTMKVGKVVPTRERTRLRTKPEARALPLLWASDVRPSGNFVFRGSERSPAAGWFLPYKKDKLKYLTRSTAVLVQRSSNREQKRRLNAAAVPKAFVKKVGKKGYVAENHVIVLETKEKRPLLSAPKVVLLLHSRIVNERFSAVSGTFNVSATLLRRLSLPDPEKLQDKRVLKSASKLRKLFESLPDILVPG